jgi:hypothetical protein
MRRLDLISDCARCAGLCCIATSFDASEDFAFDKPAGMACRHLTPEHRCAIHDHLAQRGFSGCAGYECYGAGPRASASFAGCADHRRRDEAFLVLRSVHELLWLLSEALKLCPPSHPELSGRLTLAIDTLDRIASGPVHGLSKLDLDSHCEESHALLRRVGEALGGRDRMRLPVLR